jgi:chitinase
MRTPTITRQEAQELRGLWQQYRDATTHVLEIMSEGTDGAASPKILAEDSKASAAIKRIQEIYRGEGKSTLIPGATEPPKIEGRPAGSRTVLGSGKRCTSRIHLRHT